MNNFVQALDMSINTQNWYSVLFISLTLPDICGKIDEPSKNSKERTINWYNKYLKQAYTHRFEQDGSVHVFLSGSDFYALRCAYLHEGSDDIKTQRAQEILEKFRFVQPMSDKSFIHRNQNNSTLQLQVSQFGRDVMEAVNSWLKDIEADADKCQKINELLNIEMIREGQMFSV